MPVIICDKEKGENLQLANNDELSGDDGSHVEQAGQKDVVMVTEENQEVLDVATRSKGKRLSLFHPLDTGCSEKLCFSHNSLQPLPRLHHCKRPSKLSSKCEYTVTPICW